MIVLRESQRTLTILSLHYSSISEAYVDPERPGNEAKSNEMNLSPSIKREEIRPLRAVENGRAARNEQELLLSRNGSAEKRRLVAVRSAKGRQNDSK